MLNYELAMSNHTGKLVTNRSTEDYLKAIFSTLARGERASTSALASQLRVADASITDMLKKLSRKGLVRYEP